MYKFYTVVEGIKRNNNVREFLFSFRTDTDCMFVISR